MNSLASLFQSRKTIRVVLGIAVVLVTLYYSLPALTTPDAKMYAVITALGSIAGLFGVDIHGIAKEDAAAKSSPTNQVNVGSEVKNPPPAAPVSEPAKPTTVSVAALLLTEIRALRASVEKLTPPLKPNEGTPEGR